MTLLSMPALFRKRHPPAGSRPGTLVVPESTVAPRMHVIRYRPDEVEDIDVEDPGALRGIVTENSISWIDIQGLGDEALLRKVAEDFAIHPLALEDVVNAPQRPKIEEYDEQLLIITRMTSLGDRLELDVEQLGIFVGDRYVITVRERYGDVLDPVRARIRDGKGRIRTSSSGYLAYAILDTIVDGYYPVVESIGEALERLEPRVMTQPGPKMLERLNRYKSILLKLRRGIWPQRDALSHVMRDGSRFVPEAVRPFLRDTYDHCAQLVEVLDSHRELVNGLMGIYLSVVSNRTNDVMKVLTIMASIFIPLTFIAGIYGMNFEGMPELHSSWGYPMTLGAMVVTAVALLYFFRRKGWLGDSHGDDDDDDET